LIPTYPDTPAGRDRWILAHRPARVAPDPRVPHASFVEEERTADGTIARGLTILLVNRECPWRCLMCDLWKFTTQKSVPIGTIPAQIDAALDQVGRGGKESPPLTQVKLYNAGSFFDPRAIPPADHGPIADRVRLCDRVIVECHPALVGDNCLKFRDLLVQGAPPAAPGHPRLEVAMGLETANPDVLERLNKRMTLDQFRRAAGFLRAGGVALRVFVLVQPPFLDEADSLHWGQRSIDFAFDCGATAVSLIPVRAGNGALEVLAAQGQFTPPRIGTVETLADYGVGLGRGRVFVDLWDLPRFASCPVCFELRRSRLESQNLDQVVMPRVACPACGAG
jgi:archaeosine synthase beta-subunit